MTRDLRTLQRWACLTPKQEAALRRGQGRLQLVPAPVPLSEPERPKRRPGVVYLLLGAAVLLWLGWAGWFR